jgi:hypothetical protein
MLVGGYDSLFIMKYFEPAYLIMLSASIINWLISTKDTFSFIAAIVLSILTSYYMYWKAQEMKTIYLLKKEELKKIKNGEI